jgi:hypothetical protein
VLLFVHVTVDRAVGVGCGQLPPYIAGLVMMKRSGRVPLPPPHAPAAQMQHCSSTHKAAAFKASCWEVNYFMSLFEVAMPVQLQCHCYCQCDA